MALWAATGLLLHNAQAVVFVPRANITHTDSRHTHSRAVLGNPEAKAAEGVKLQVYVPMFL